MRIGAGRSPDGYRSQRFRKVNTHQYSVGRSLSGSRRSQARRMRILTNSTGNPATIDGLIRVAGELIRMRTLHIGTMLTCPDVNCLCTNRFDRDAETLWRILSMLRDVESVFRVAPVGTGSASRVSPAAGPVQWLPVRQRHGQPVGPGHSQSFSGLRRDGELEYRNIFRARSGSSPVSVVPTDALSTSAGCPGRSLGNGRPTGYLVLTAGPGRRGGWFPDGSVIHCPGVAFSAMTAVAIGIRF